MKMKMIIECIKDKHKCNFSDVKDKEFFVSGGVLYLKINQQDLREYNIENINAVSINGGLTKFYEDETVYRVDKKFY